MVTSEWTQAPCGLLTLLPDGTLLAVNDIFLAWTGRERDTVVGRLRLTDLLSVGGRIYWETHLSPMLYVDGRVDEVALELTGPGGRHPVLLTAVVGESADGRAVLRASVSSARDRSRYERELLAARAEAERSERRVRLLQATTAALSAALGVTALVTALAYTAERELAVHDLVVWVSDPAGQLVQRYPHEPVAEPDPARLDLLSRRAFFDVCGCAVVPLHGQSELQGALRLRPSDAAGADPLDLEVLTAIGQQAGLALDRARRYEHSAEVAHDLQHSLLAGEAPRDPRFATAVTYRPGIAMLEVGGDWHDTFFADDGLLSVVVGDVMGRGLGAAIAMGQLRSAVRAVAGPGVDPAALLTRLDRFVEQVEAASMATLAYAELDLTSGLLTYACAGHPPPLLLPAAGRPEFLWGGRSTPLGVSAGDARASAQVLLAPGDRLLLYTDGLVERRDSSIDDRLDLLRSVAAEEKGKPLGEAVQTVTDRLLEDERVRDDVCVLLLAWTPQGAP